MAARGRTVIVAVVWGVLVTALLTAVPLTLRDRLPEPLATHWNGSTADQAMSFAGNLAFGLALWLVVWAFLLGAALRGATRRTRLWRIHWWAFLFGWAVLALGVTGSTLYANLDVTDWRQAALPGRLVAAVVGAAVAVGVLAGYLGRGEPDRPRDHTETPAMRLRPGQRAVWVGHVSNPWLVGASTAALVATVAVGGLYAAGVLADQLARGILIPLLVVTLLGFATSSVGVRVDGGGLRVGFGPFGRLAYRIPIGKIESAWAEERLPAQVGGWGLRGLPGTGRMTVMLRGGDHLVIRRTGGGVFAVSADDAERGAALLNAYIAERSDS